MSDLTAETVARQKLELGCHHEESGRFSEAFQLYLEAAEAGCPEAQVNLANLLDDGKGCVRNPRRAVYWYKKAVKNGCACGANNLGMHYRNKGNKKLARCWLRVALAMGDAWAAEELRALG